MCALCFTALCFPASSLGEEPVLGASKRIAFSLPEHRAVFSGNGQQAKARLTTLKVLVRTENGLPLAGVPVTFSATMDDRANQAMHPERRGLFYGLHVNGRPGGKLFPLTQAVSDAHGMVQLTLEDCIGERSLALTASMPSGKSVLSDKTLIHIEPGPLSSFRLINAQSPETLPWADRSPLQYAARFAAAEACGGIGNPDWYNSDYSHPTRLPAVQELLAVSSQEGNAAALAAGWPAGSYWSGQLEGTDMAYAVDIESGAINYHPTSSAEPFVLCRR